MEDSDKNLPQETETQQMTKEDVRRAKEKLSATRRQQKQREKNLKLKRKQLERRRAEKEKQKKMAIDARRRQEKKQIKHEKKREDFEKDKQEFLKKEYRRAAINKRKEEERIRKKMRARAEKRRVDRQYALEAKLVAMGKIPARPKGGNGHGFFWNVFAVCAAFLIGVVAVIGGLIGGGYYALSKVSVDQLLSAIGLESSKYITPDYASSTLLDLGKDLFSTSFENLNSIGKYTPLLENTLEKADDQFADLGISFNVPKMMDVPFGELGGYLKDEVIYQAELGKALGVDGNTDRLVATICYGKKDKDYSVDPETNKIIPIEGGREPVKIGDLASGDSIIGDLAVEDIMEIREESPAFLKATASWTIDMFGERHRIDRLKIKQILNIGENPNALLDAIQNWRIKDLTDQSKLDSLQLGNVIEITADSPKILQSLANTQIGKLGEKVNELCLSDILDDDSMNGNKILRHLKGSTLNSLSADLSALTIGEVFGDEIYSYMDLSTVTVSSGKTAYESALQTFYTNRTNTSSDVPTPPTALTGGTVATVYTAQIDSASKTVNIGYFLDNALVDSDTPIKTRNTDDSVVFYILEEVQILPVYEYKQVDYTTGDLIDVDGVIARDSEGLFLQNAKGKFRIEENDFTLYYIAADGTETHLEAVITGYTDTAGNPCLAQNDQIYTKKDGSETKYYYQKELPVEQRYYYNENDTNCLVEDSAVTVSYQYTKNDTTVSCERYLSGVWFLLFVNITLPSTGSSDLTVDISGLDTSVLEMNTLISNTSTKISGVPLWELYFHGLLNNNPAYNLTSGSSANLCNLTIDQVINYIKNGALPSTS